MKNVPLVPGGLRHLRAQWTEKLPNSHNWKIAKQVELSANANFLKIFSTYNETGQSCIDLSIWRGCVKGMINVVWHISGKSPIVGAVLEQVHDRHCCIGKSVNENRFQKTLNVVKCPTTGCNIYYWFYSSSWGWDISIKQPRTSGNPKVDQKGSCILRQEHGCPTNLQSSVFEIEHGSTVKSKFSQSRVIFQCFSFGLWSQFLAVNISVLTLDIANGLFDIFDGTSFGKLFTGKR